ncbi:phytanoyl-CoA dioxygenase family protein [Spirosoma radiotolerans]|uniref:Phytanoyl-CoA dioxygenase n=1 Tax=Spirosoma radiotolerans TaxID=1379870 RepID=A0A0E3ZYZ9_9BACT|nr:phytanoyl-CoA dioxygenase family protein [Spirosoma radiotolerans]AKD57325.1 phytanoyl-CoA dioxygenase [Spirosoma radiotolerans]
MTSILTKLKTVAKQVLRPEQKAKYITEFAYDSLPWIDKSDADIDAFVKQFPAAKELPYDLGEKLLFWRENGYVILGQAIPTEWLDQLWREIEELIEHHEKYQTQVRIDLPEYQANPVQPVKDVPKSVLNGPFLKFNDFHDNSVIGKKIMLHKNIVTFLEAVFGDKVIAMQSLLFKYGSQQPTHQDFAYVVSEIPSHLAAAWIALEDVHIDSGPLSYYPGSHKIKKFDFGNGIFFNGKSTLNPNDFAKYLDAACQRAGLKKKTLLIKKGEVLIWHAALAHGGEEIRNPAQTRKSYVCHYSSEKAYKHHRQSPTTEPVRRTMNGADVFVNPTMPDQEDIFDQGKMM